MSEIKRNYNTKQTTTMLALDLEKAFDTVWHKGLINKMIRYLSHNIIKVIRNYLQERENAVNVNTKE